MRFHYSYDELITCIQDRHVRQTLVAMDRYRWVKEKAKECSKRPPVTVEEFFSIRG